MKIHILKWLIIYVFLYVNNTITGLKSTHFVHSFMYSLALSLNLPHAFILTEKPLKRSGSDDDDTDGRSNKKRMKQVGN